MGSDGGQQQQPELSTEERDLLREQVTVLREQRTQAQEQLRMQNLLAPALYQAVGLRPTTRPVGDAAAQYRTLQQELAQQGARWEAAGRAENAVEQAAAAERVTQLRQQIQGLRQGISFDEGAYLSANPDVAAAVQQGQYPSGLEHFLTYGATEQRPGTESARTGDITGFESITPDDPLAPQRAEIERLFTERSLAALRGELPVDPALLRGVEEQRQTLDDVFQQRLGPGFQTSSPYIEAKQRLEESVNLALDQARRGDLSMAEALGISRGESTQIAGLRRIGATQSIFGGGGSLGDLIGGYQGPLSTLSQLRNQQIGVANQNAQLSYQQRQQEGAAIGAAAGLAGSFLGVGSAFTPLINAGANYAYTGQAPTNYGGYGNRPTFGSSVYQNAPTPQGVTYYSNPDYAYTAPSDAGGYR